MYPVPKAVPEEVEQLVVVVDVAVTVMLVAGGVVDDGLALELALTDALAKAGLVGATVLELGATVATSEVRAPERE